MQSVGLGHVIASVKWEAEREADVAAPRIRNPLNLVTEFWIGYEGRGLFAFWEKFDKARSSLNVVVAW